jgi:hypothetical protein
MASERFIWSAELQKWCPPSQALAARPRYDSRSDLPCPHVISDHLPDIINHADGKLYDSKSSYYAAVKAAGCEVVGNDPAFADPKGPDNTPKGIEQDISDAYDQVVGV